MGAGQRIIKLHAELKADPKIRWKDELKKILGLSSNERAGMDE